MNTQTGWLMVVSGPSGVGKGRVCQHLLENTPNLSWSVSYTSRLPRPGEVNGQHYHFVDEATFKALIAQGKLLEYNCYNGFYYGTGAEAVQQTLCSGQSVLMEIDVNGARQMKTRVQELNIPALLVFIAPPSLEELETRLRSRGTEDEATVQNRLQIAQTELQEAHWFDVTVVNQTVEACAKSILAALKTKKGD